MDLSIVIVSYNTKEMLRDCLNALPAAASGLEFETFVVDNNSPDQSADMVAGEFPNVKLIANTENAGFTRANNQALKISSGRHIVLLNPDTEARPGSLATLVDYLDARPDVGAVGPKLLNTDGTLQKNGSSFPDPLTDFLVISQLGNLNRPAIDRRVWRRDDFDVECDVPQVSGACLMVRGAVMKQVGMLDEDFFMFFEETEWCRRIRNAGWTVAYVPQAVVVHHWMGSVRQNSRAMTNRLFKSSRIYYRKTGGRATQLANRLVLTFGTARNEFIHFGVAVKRRLRILMGCPRPGDFG
jgi:GT2 family glycosyltransferase